MLTRSLTLREKALGPEHPDVGVSHNNLAELYRAQGRYTEAERLYNRSLPILEKALGPEHPTVATVLNNLAELAFSQNDWARAADYWRRSTGVIKRRAQRGLADGRGEASGRGGSKGWRRNSGGLVKAAHRLGCRASIPPRPLQQKCSRPRSGRKARKPPRRSRRWRRGRQGSSELGGLVRERQDLVGEWQSEGQAAHRRQERSSRGAQG